MGGNGQIRTGVHRLVIGCLRAVQGQAGLGDLILQSAGVQHIEHLSGRNRVPLLDGTGEDLGADGRDDGILLPIAHRPCALHKLLHQSPGLRMHTLVFIHAAGAAAQQKQHTGQRSRTLFQSFHSIHLFVIPRS